MKKSAGFFLILFILFSMMTTSAKADAVFSLVNGSYDSNRIESGFDDYGLFFKTIRIDFTQNGDTTYTGYGETSVTRSYNDLYQEHSVTGHISIEYDSQTGLMDGNYEIIHIYRQFPSPSNVYRDGSIIHTYTGRVEGSVEPGATFVMIRLNGEKLQTIEGTPYGKATLEPGMDGMEMSWDFDIPFEVEGNIPGQSCRPEVMGIESLKPGDTLDPDALYFAVDGSEVEPLSESWIINGERTDSITWQGEVVTIDLQWTCPDQKSYTKSFTIEAFQEPTAISTPTQSHGLAPSAGEESQSAEGGISPLGITGIITGALAVLGISGLFITNSLKYPAVMKPSSPSAASTPPSFQPNPSIQPSVTPPPLSSQPSFTTTTTPPPLMNQPSFSQQSSPTAHRGTLTPQQVNELINLRNEMSNEAEQIKIRWRNTRDAVNKLKKLKKKNMLKFLIKQGFEVQNWIMDSPVEVINKLTIDPAMEKAFQKHDSSQDGNIVVSIHNRILSLEAEMQEMVKSVKYLNSEINKINHRISK